MDRKTETETETGTETEIKRKSMLRIEGVVRMSGT